VLDLCAGVGTLGLAIARRRPDACVWCLERDDTAVQYLRRNLARQAAVTGQLTVQVADLMEPDCLDAHAGATDVIVANPPYVPPSQPLPPEWAEHHPRAAVYGGADGFDVIRRIAALGAITLRPDGQLALEHDRSQPEAVQQILIHHGYSDVTTVTDSAGDRRITVARIAAKEQSG